MSTTFQKKIEDFTCEHCGAKVKGTGFTNHCPFCLWSKHVDIYPGDRNNPCGGMMEPIRAELKNGKYYLIQRCVKCKLERRNKTVENDKFEEILKLAS